MSSDTITTHNYKNEFSINSLSSSNDFKDLDLTNLDLGKYMGKIDGNDYNNETFDPINTDEGTTGHKIKNQVNCKILEKSLINNTQNSTIQKEGKTLPPTQYTSKEIKKMISILNIGNIIKDNFIIDEKIVNIEKYMSDEIFNSKQKRNRTKPKKPKEDKKKLGRKKKDDPQKGKHTKISNDNMIKKIKSSLLDYLLLFVNNNLNSLFDDNKIKSYIKIMKNNKNVKEPKKEGLIKNLDYNKFINKTEKKINLQFLKMPLKVFLSQDISEKYKTLNKNSNKRVIEEILLNENDNEIIKIIFEKLTLGDWIDIFTYKKELKDFGFSDEEKNKFIMDNFIRVENLLEKIYNLHNGDNYFSLFIIILYNYERYFFIKIGRKTKKEKK